VKRFVKGLRQKKGLILLALPGVLFFLAFYYLPMFGTVISFKAIDYSKGIWSSPWVGLQNFEFFFTSQNFLRITRNTVGLNLLFIMVNLVVSVTFAIMLFELPAKAVKVFQTVLFFPYLLSWVVVSFALYIFLNMDYGVLNSLAKMFGAQPVNWYGDPGYWPWILLISYLWKNVGYSTIVYYTGLLGIDAGYYEAASIDGANRLQQIRYITLPLLIPLVVMLLITALGRIFSADFGMFYFLSKDSPMLYETTDVIDTYVFRALRKIGDVGMSAAVSFYQSVVGLVLVVTFNSIVRRMSEESALY